MLRCLVSSVPRAAELPARNWDDLFVAASRIRPGLASKWDMGIRVFQKGKKTSYALWGVLRLGVVHVVLLELAVKGGFADAEHARPRVCRRQSRAACAEWRGAPVPRGEESHPFPGGAR